MNIPCQILDPVVEEQWLDLEGLAQATSVDAAWLRERVQAGLLAATPLAPDAWRFEVSAIRRVRCLARLERNFDAAPELAALVADLQDEIERLRARVGH